MSSERVIVDTNGQQFRADSFDRFGDDLCEELLSFMSFEDKIRLECVAKQWSRLVFNKQSVLVVDTNEKSRHRYNVRQLLIKDKHRYRGVDINRLKTMLKKCPNITRIEFNYVINDQILQTITEYWL